MWRLSSLRPGFVVGLLALVLAAPPALGLRDALGARGALESARASLVRARSALGAGEIEEARGEVEAARAAVSSARSRTDGPVWAAGRRLPVLRPSVEIVGTVVDLVAAAVEVADDAVRRADGLVGADGSLPVALRGGRIDPAPFGQAAEVLASLPTSPLERARERLAALDTGLVPGAVREGRRRALDEASRSLAALGRARGLLTVMPAFLGAEGPRRYLVALQSPAELRGTGGLLGFYLPLVVEQGRIRLGPGVGLPAGTSAGGSGPLAVPPHGVEPVATTAAFADRYAHVAADRNFSNVNLDPDLPTVAPVVLDLVEARTGGRFDGMIALDPLAVAELTRATGPLPVPPEVRDADPRIPARVGGDRLAALTLREVYEIHGEGDSERRDAFFGALVAGAVDQMLSAGGDTAELGRHLATAADERHLQLYSRQPREQAAFEAAGIAGALPPAGRTGDLLALTANNANGGKQDVWVAHTLEGRLRLILPSSPAGGDEVRAERRGTLRVGLGNPLPSRGMDLTIIGNCLVDRPEMQCFDGPPGLNRTWYSLWGPPDLQVTAARGHDGEPVPVSSDRIHGHRVIDHVLETPPRSSRFFGLELAGPVRLQRDGPELHYELLLWRQAKAIPDHLDVTVEAPPGWSVEDAVVEGGGDGEGMGARPEGPRLSAQVVEGGAAVRLTGAVTADAHLRVRFTRGLWERLAGMLP